MSAYLLSTHPPAPPHVNPRTYCPPQGCHAPASHNRAIYHPSRTPAISLTRSSWILKKTSGHQHLGRVLASRYHKAAWNFSTLRARGLHRHRRSSLTHSTDLCLTRAAIFRSRSDNDRQLRASRIVRPAGGVRSDPVLLHLVLVVLHQHPE